MTPTAGGVLAAVDAIHHRETFTRKQVAYLMQLAYDSGRTATYVGDLAELHTGWARHPQRQAIADERYQQRMAGMAANAAQVNAEMGRPPGYEYHGGPVNWAGPQGATT